MKAILIKEVKNLGHRDDIVNVSDGYFRNYLFPRQLAVVADKAHLAELEKRHKTEEAKGEKALEEAKTFADKLNETQITISGKVGSGTKLYGSITPADIAEALEKQSEVSIDKRKIELEEPIKALGTYEVSIRLHSLATATLKVEIVGEQSSETE